MVSEYDSYEGAPGLHVNGQLTIGENIGDLSGLVIALQAYHYSLNGKAAPVIDGYTGDQRFFLGFARMWRNKTRGTGLRRQPLSSAQPNALARRRIHPQRRRLV